MPDVTVTVHYIITAIVNHPDNTATVTYILSHTDTRLTKTRNDIFPIADLTNGVNTSTDTSAQKLAALQSNFEKLAAFYFKDFAAAVRISQSATDDQTLIDADNDVAVTSISASHLLSLEGDVACQ